MYQAHADVLEHLCFGDMPRVKTSWFWFSCFWPAGLLVASGFTLIVQHKHESEYVRKAGFPLKWHVLELSDHLNTGMEQNMLLAANVILGFAACYNLSNWLDKVKPQRPT